MECPISYELSDGKGNTMANGEATAALEEDTVTILPHLGEPILFSPREITRLSAKDYRLSLSLGADELLSLYDLGYAYEDFTKALCRLRNEVLLKDMLMHEKVREKGFEAEHVLVDGAGNEISSGICEPRFFETALVILPEIGEPFRMPYSHISETKEESYAIVIGTEDGNKVRLSAMGHQFDPFKSSLSKAMAELSQRTQAWLKELVPGLDSSGIRKASRLLKDGRSARKCDLDSISPLIWKSLEKKISSAGLKDEYDTLRSMARQDHISIGIKRGLFGEVTGEYIWYLIPVYDTDAKKPGNAVIMGSALLEDKEGEDEGEIEAGSGADEAENTLEGDEGKSDGKATYVFRIMERKIYSEIKDLEELDRAADSMIRTINDSMAAINFRREPVYLPEEKLYEPKYVKYLYSIQRLPQLRTLRKAYVGRVVHTSPEQWKKGISALLSFNVSTTDDSKVWKNG
ncbi:hypothetical protein CUJ83_06315 [Methanocella sp. CWC-04]|uniref:Uncharacterized protein n=2 Tax=Methanooceanicella nereidis TaxID=2052831 RepID=A0AAP2W5S3_9EURY|nr:hypothetical protein [Methanocella sp. CWC-04]